MKPPGALFGAGLFILIGKAVLYPMEIPAQANTLIYLLEQYGFEAYLVGGCVRDSLLGLAPQDWDVCTSARPADLLRCFSEKRTLPTGIRHGTITVWESGVPFEVTSFRIDGIYSDRRHPDSIRFTGSLKEDLARRDFTVNAMAFHPQKGIFDYFGGREDLNEGKLRCVGDPKIRFSEDALRMLRALRFAACYGFQIVLETADAVHAQHPFLKGVSPERIQSELSRLLCGRAAGQTLRQFPDVLCTLIPQIDPAAMPALLPSVCRRLDRCPASLSLRLAVLLEGCGLDSPVAGAVLSSLRFDRRTASHVRFLLDTSEEKLPDSPVEVKRQLRRWGAELFFEWIALKQSEELSPKKELEKACETAKTIQKERQCYQVKDLCITGSDLTAAGLPEGPAVGKALSRLCDQVIEGSLPNERQALLHAALSLYRRDG